MGLNRKVLIVGLGLVVPLLVFLAMGFRFDPHEMSSPLIDQEAPRFRLDDLDGNRFDLEQLRGRPVVINFWSTWCAPCIQEHPVLMAAANHYGERVQFLGIVYQDEISKIEEFQQRFGAWGPSLVDPGGKTAIAYGVYGPPETFFVDANGVIVDKVIGAVHPDQLKATVDALL